MKHIIRCVPELALIKLNECLENDTPLFKFEKESFFFILDLFYRLPAYNKGIRLTEEGLIRISCKYFRKYITNGYANYINYLIRHNIIECDKIKAVGKAYAYCLSKHLESKIVKVQIHSGTVIFKRIIENTNKKKKNHKKIPEHIKEMKAHFKKNMKINLKEALNWCEEELSKKTISINQYNVFVLSIYAIDEKDIYFKVNDTNGRIDSNLTNLKSELRQFIIGDFKHIDCQNSQPLIVNFLTDYITNNNTTYQTESIQQPYPSLGDEEQKNVLRELSDSELEYLKFFPKLTPKTLKEFGQFRTDTFDKDFYRCVQTRYEQLYGKPILRKDVKEIIYKVLFSKNRSYRDEKKVFKELYPTVYKIIHALKKEKHNRLDICLQRIESEMFIQRICKRLVENGIIPFTIHDSVVVIASDRLRALEIMKEEYVKFLNQSPEFICTEL